MKNQGSKWRTIQKSPEIHRNPGSPGSWAEEVESLELPPAGASKTEFDGDGVVCPWNGWFEARKYGFGKDRDRNQEEL